MLYTHRYILYFGALQAWQGLPVLFKSMLHLRHIDGLRLRVVAASPPKQSKILQKLAEKLGIDSQVDWFFNLNKDELREHIQGALLSVAPLTECSRNVEQGCCPLKILESMACGTPVVASDLPVVREIMQDGVHGKLVRPDRPVELARAIRMVLEDEAQRLHISHNARLHIQENFLWATQQQKLQALYDSLLHKKA